MNISTMPGTYYVLKYQISINYNGAYISLVLHAVESIKIVTASSLHNITQFKILL